MNYTHNTVLCIFITLKQRLPIIENDSFPLPALLGNQLLLPKYLHNEFSVKTTNRESKIKLTPLLNSTLFKAPKINFFNNKSSFAHIKYKKTNLQLKTLSYNINCLSLFYKIHSQKNLTPLFPSNIMSSALLCFSNTLMILIRTSESMLVNSEKKFS